MEAAPDILAKFVGVYKGLYLERPRTVEVTLSDGTLFIALNGGQKPAMKHKRNIEARPSAALQNLEAVYRQYRQTKIAKPKIPTTPPKQLSPPPKSVS